MKKSYVVRVDGRQVGNVKAKDSREAERIARRKHARAIRQGKSVSVSLT